MIVVDASVAVKWFVPEPGEEAAQQLLKGAEPLVAPGLIRLEVGSAVLRCFRDGRIKEDKAHTAIEDWEKLLADGIMQRVDDNELFKKAVDLSFACRHKLADCFYLAVATMFNAQLITADRPLIERGKAIYPNITLLVGSNPN